MTTKLAGGRVYDPLNDIDGRVMDLWIRDGRMIPPPEGGRADEVIDLTGKVVMPGGIDLHPFGAGEIGRGDDAFLLAQQVVGHLAAFEADLGTVARPPIVGNGEDLAADLPDRGTAPLHHMRGHRQRAAESVEFRAGHRR